MAVYNGTSGSATLPSSKVAPVTEQTKSVVDNRMQRVAQRVATSHEQTKNYVRALAAGNINIVSRVAFTTTSQAATSTLLSFAVAAGETWDVEYWGFGHNSAAGGMKYAIYAPNSSTVSGTLESSSTNTAVANWLIDTFSAPNTLSVACHAGATNAGRPDRINVRVTTVYAGVVAIQVASVTAASTTTVDAAALLRATRSLVV